MINNDRFALETSTFIPVVIDTFKTIPSRMYGKYKLIHLREQLRIQIYH
jgi:hypothetical protein